MPTTLGGPAPTERVVPTGQPEGLCRPKTGRVAPTETVRVARPSPNLYCFLLLLSPPSESPDDTETIDTEKG